MTVKPLIRRILCFLKIKVLIPAHHAVQHGVTVLGEALIREGNIQRGQHLQHRCVLLYVLITVLDEPAAGELLLGEIVQRLVNGCGYVLAVLIRRKGLYGFCRQQDIVKAVRFKSISISSRSSSASTSSGFRRAAIRS